jgi:hypothetical protein
MKECGGHVVTIADGPERSLSAGEFRAAASS